MRHNCGFVIPWTWSWKAERWVLIRYGAGQVPTVAQKRARAKETKKMASFHIRDIFASAPGRACHSIQVKLRCFTNDFGNCHLIAATKYKGLNCSWTDEFPPLSFNPRGRHLETRPERERELKLDRLIVNNETASGFKSPSLSAAP